MILQSPCFISHPCSTFKYVPPGPELFKSFCATDSIASSMMLIGIKIVVSLYVSNVSQQGIVSLRLPPSKTYVTVSLIVAIQYIVDSYDCKTLLFYMSHKKVRLCVISPSGRSSKTLYDVPLQFNYHKVF